MILSNLSDRGTLRGCLGRVTDDYNNLINKPAINGHELVGNQGAHDLDIANLTDIIPVEANPIGAASDDLKKILIADTIYNIPDVIVYGKASGAIASFDDGGDNKPLKSLKVAINPVQSGSGDPSPSNVRPISGWSGANVQRCGKNLFNEKFSDYSASNAYLYYGRLPNNQALNISFEDKDTSIDISGISIGFAYNYTTGAVTSYRWSINNGVISSNLTNVTNRGDYGNTIIIYPNNETTFNKLKARYNIKITIGSDAESYEPFNGTTYPITWSEAGTVYAGTLDVTNGTLKARPYYASYNGEALVGPWISSLDKYVEGTTPTTGAQVVDLGGTETTYQLTPTQVKSLLGTNNIWSDTGNILECVYQRDLNIVINKLLQQ